MGGQNSKIKLMSAFKKQEINYELLILMESALSRP